MKHEAFLSTSPLRKAILLSIKFPRALCLLFSLKHLIFFKAVLGNQTCLPTRRGPLIASVHYSALIQSLHLFANSQWLIKSLLRVLKAFNQPERVINQVMLCFLSCCLNFKRDWFNWSYFYASVPVVDLAGGVMFSGFPSVRTSIRSILVNAISWERLEGISSDLPETSTWTQG